MFRSLFYIISQTIVWRSWNILSQCKSLSDCMIFNIRQVKLSFAPLHLSWLHGASPIGCGSSSPTLEKLGLSGLSVSRFWISLFSLLGLSQQLGYTNVKSLVDLRGVGLKREACKQKHVPTVQYLPLGRERRNASDERKAKSHMVKERRTEKKKGRTIDCSCKMTWDSRNEFVSCHEGDPWWQSKWASLDRITPNTLPMDALPV